MQIDLNVLSTIMGIIVNLIGLAYIAVRVEHRLTKMETHIEHLMLETSVKKGLENGSTF